MNRREFLLQSVAAGVSLTLFEPKRAFSKPLSNQTYDLVAIKNKSPKEMFDAGISSLGGMKALVKPNQKVVVKPNIGWDVDPKRAANTNPELVARIVEHCVDAGAKEVFVLDHTCDPWKQTYQNSGISQAVKNAKGKMAPAHAEGYFHGVSIPRGVKLKQAKVHELVLEADVLINVPVLKHHSSAEFSIAMKNLMGVVWDRRYWHRNDLDQCIADFATICRPHLNVVDAYRVMKQNGPRGVSIADVALYKTQILSTDMVAIDAAASKIMNADPSSIRYIHLAHALGVGKKDLAGLKIHRIKL